MGYISFEGNDNPAPISKVKVTKVTIIHLFEDNLICPFLNIITISNIINNLLEWEFPKVYRYFITKKNGINNLKEWNKYVKVLLQG